MNHQTQVRLLKTLMEQRDTDTNADTGRILRNPASAYTCNELAERERQTFFREHPQIIGMSGDLPSPGSFMTLEEWGVPVLATRDKDGRFRSFINACRHRGARVESAERGNRKHFSCPFHAWTYANDGRLTSIPKPHHFGAIDMHCHGLQPLPAEERHGFLWVHPDPKGSIDATALLGGLAEEFDSWDFGSLDYVGSDRYEAPINWKLGLDTFGETYHFDCLHRDTLAKGFYGNTLAYETFERNHRMVLCLKSLDALRDTPEADWDIRQGGFPVYFLYPNVVLNVGQLGVIMVRISPIPGEPGSSISRLSFYFDQEAIAAGAVMKSLNGSSDDDTPANPFEEFSAVVRDEDYVVAAQTQKTAESGLQEYLLFGRNEPPLHHYHNTFRAALGMTPLQSVEGAGS